MLSHDPHDHSRKGARLHYPQDDEPTLVGDERYDQVWNYAVVLVVVREEPPAAENVE